jgi:hypothetical protein
MEGNTPPRIKPMAPPEEYKRLRQVQAYPSKENLRKAYTGGKDLWPYSGYDRYVPVCARCLGTWYAVGDLGRREVMVCGSIVISGQASRLSRSPTGCWSLALSQRPSKTALTLTIKWTWSIMAQKLESCKQVQCV